MFKRTIGSLVVVLATMGLAIPAGAQLPFTDDFNRATIGSNWLILTETPTWQITANDKLEQTSTSSSLAKIICTGAGQVANGVVEVTGDFLADGGYPVWGIMFRHDDTNQSYYEFRITIDRWYLGTNWNDGWFTLGQGTYPPGFDRSAAHTMKVEFDGDLIICYIDSKQVVITRNSNYSTGDVGLKVHNADAQFDDFSVDSFTYSEVPASFSDDFNRASIGSDWEPGVGTWNISGSVALHQSDTGVNEGYCVASGAGNYTDVTVEVDTDIVTAGAWPTAEVVFGWQGEGNYYYFRNAPAAGQFILQKRKAGGWGDLNQAYTPPGGFDFYAPHTLKVEMTVSGADVTISCYVDDVKVINSVTDPNTPNLTIGQVGVRTHNAEVTWDNFNVTPSVTAVEDWASY